MLKKDVLDSQVAVELPAREMLGHNFAAVYTRQTNLNAQLGLVNVQLAQVNASEVIVIQD